MTVSPGEATDAANYVYGRHPGYRALHAKGTLLKGTFTATPEAAALTRAGHMQGEPVPVTVRVSNGGGNPEIPDYAPDVRGFAVKFYLPDGAKTDIVAQTLPKFPFHDADGFVELLRAQKRGPEMLWKLPLFLVRHPKAAASLPETAKLMRPPASYAALRYYAIHAYKFVDAQGGSRYVRYTLVPETTAPPLGGGEAKGRGRDYLQEEIRGRVDDGTVRFTLELQVAEPGDEVDDPASEWPAERRRVNAGTIECSGLDTVRETGDDVLVFDPTRVVDGIECSDDPVLAFRKRAYSDSIARRMQHGG
jgi:catalase